MKLAEIQKPYDLFVGLGSACDPAAHLRTHDLRRYSMPLDWLVTSYLSEVSRLFENRFAGFMELESLQLIDGSANFYDEENPIPSNAPLNTHFIEDKAYKTISVHDFPNIEGRPWQDNYPAFKQKLDLRIARLMSEIAGAESVLFIRWAGVTADAVALRSVLSGLTDGTADLLVLQPTEVDGVVEQDNEHDGLCLLQVPNLPADTTIWDPILRGMSLRPAPD